MSVIQNRNKDPGLGTKTTLMSSFKKLRIWLQISMTEQLNGKSLSGSWCVSENVKLCCAFLQLKAFCNLLPFFEHHNICL